MKLRLRHQRLAELMAAASLSQNHWAIKVGISRGHWSEIVNGKHPYISARTRVRILEAFDVPVEDLFEIETGPSPWGEGDFKRAISDRYLVDSEIGQGGMGAVYLARDVRHGRAVAIKVISAEIVSGVGLTQFEREIATVARLTHPNILPLFDSGDAAGQPFFVMPLIRGGSLRQRIESRVRLGLGETVQLIHGIARALDHAHRERILHCDVKPENVLLFDDHPFVMDFGIARTLRRELDDLRLRDSLDLSAGTPAYVSPEQAAGAPDLDGRSDVYSLGCLVFEMLTGRPPFEGRNTQVVVSRRFIEPPPRIREFAPDIPEGVQSVIDRALSLPREQRYATTLAFAHELERAATTHSVLLGRASLAISRSIGAVRRALSLSPQHRLGANLLDFTRDVRIALRGIRRAPSFALIVVLTLGLALGTNATMFSVVDRLLLRMPAQVRNPERIVKVKVARFISGQLGERSTSMSYPAFTDIRDRTSTLENVTAVDRATLSLGVGAQARPITVEMATGNYFALLGAVPYRGRFFDASDDRAPSGSNVIVLSRAFSKNVFGATQDPVGKTLLMNGRRFEVIGVAPDDFTGASLESVDGWVPMSAGISLFNPSYESWANSRGSQFLHTLARLKDGVSVTAASQDVQRAYHAGHESYLEYESKAVASLGHMITSRDSDSGSAEPRVSVWLFAMAIVVLLVACANLASLTLARGIDRQSEFAVRRALGVTDGRLARMLLVEATILATTGVIVGLLLARLGSALIRDRLFPDMHWGRLLDVRILLVTFVCALLAVLVAEWMPLWRSTRVGIGDVLRGASRSVAGGSRHVLAALLIVQTSLATALLIGAGLFVNSVRQVRSLDLGFESNQLLSVQPNLSSTNSADVQSFFSEAVERISRLPGVTAVGAAVGSPFGQNYAVRIRAPGVDSIPKQPGGGPYRFQMTPGAMQAMQLHLLQGRLPTDADARNTSAAPVVLTQRMAQVLFPGRDPLAQCVMVGKKPCAPVIGVVGDIHRQGLLEEPFLALFTPFELSDSTVSPVFIAVRSNLSTAAITKSIRDELSRLRPDLPFTNIVPYSQIIDPQARSWTLGASMFGLFGLLSLLIAVIGVFGVYSYTVNARTREIGIRAALGASPMRILVEVVRNGAVVAAIGVMIGIAAALAASPFIGKLLFDTSATDPRILGVAAAVIVLASLTAVVVPGRRAARIDPLTALRAE